MANKLTLDRDRVDSCRDLALGIVRPVQKYIQLHSTAAVERATLRLLGINEPKEAPQSQRYPLANQVVDRVDRHKLALGISFWMGLAKLANPELSLVEIAQKVRAGEIDLNALSEAPADKIRQVLADEARQAMQKIDRQRKNRERYRDIKPWAQDPLKYIVVSTGNVYEDIVQARQAAFAGADIISVVRASAQSLLDYVPWGATTEGYAGTYTTQENARLMRDALDDVGKEVRRYVRLSFNSSGLCMPEITVLGAIEGADMLQGDPMYGILFRDINMKRSFVDQYVSRLIMAKAGMIVSTEEDHYYDHLDDFEASPQVITSHFINECFADAAGLKEERVSLSHSFCMDPGREDSMLYEMAMAQLVRDLFPRSPIKFVPPVRYKTGDVFFSHVLDSFFTMVGNVTRQSIVHLGLPSEAARTPALHDRYAALKSARYVLGATRSMNSDMLFRSNGVVMRRARTVLDNAIRYLTKIKDLGLMTALEKGMFLGVTREKNSGKGLEGVFQKARIYYNPCLDLLEKKNGSA